MEESEHMGAGVYVSFYVSPESFDEIVRMASEPGIVLHAIPSLRISR
jgi:hypothetical protein